MNTHLAEALDGIEVVKGHAQETAEVDRFGSFAIESRNAFVRQGDVEARFLPLLLMGNRRSGRPAPKRLSFTSEVCSTSGKSSDSLA